MKSTSFFALMLLGVVSKADNQLRDFPACGFRNEISAVQTFIPQQVQQRDECLWDCTWVPNPFYRANWTVQLIDEYLKNPENLEEKVVFKDVNYFMMTPKIPKDLTCLDGCYLPKLVSLKQHFIKTGKHKIVLRCHRPQKFKLTVQRNQKVISTAT